MQLRHLLSATALAAPLALAGFLAPGTAQAQPIDGLYVAGGAGANFFSDEKFRSSADIHTPSMTLRDSTGYVGLGSVGYGLGNGLRFELEGNYRNNHVNKFTGTSFPTTAGGLTQQYGVMANVLFDTDVGLPWMFPYIGAGAGYGWADFSPTRVSGTTRPFAAQTTGTEGGFAYQGIVGASFPIPMTPGLSATLEYRYYGIAGTRGYKASSLDALSPTSGPAYGTWSTKGDTADQSVLLGLRYAFNTAPPPPPPAPAPVAAPAPAPSRTYLVFFDWDRADLTDRARQIIHEAATNSTRVQYTRIAVNGYTDLSGSPAYNQGLSVRRAQTVAAELVRDGVARSAINIQGFGENNPLVPTAKGVREPQNRRVEIIIQ